MSWVLTDDRKANRVDIGQRHSFKNIFKKTSYHDALRLGLRLWCRNYGAVCKERIWPAEKSSHAPVNDEDDVFKGKGSVNYEFVPRDQTVNKEFHMEVLRCCTQEETWAVGKSELHIAQRQRASSRITSYLQQSGKHEITVLLTHAAFHTWSQQTFSYFENLKQYWDDVSFKL